MVRLFFISAFFVSVVSCTTNKKKTVIRSFDKADAREAIKIAFKWTNPDTTIYARFLETYTQPSKAQLAVLRAFEDRQPDLVRTIQDSIFAYYRNIYPELQRGAEVSGLSGPELQQTLPIPRSSSALKSFYKPLLVLIGAPGKAQIGTVGIVFTCSWDAEHQLGIFIEDWRLSRVGPADFAFPL
jgi:hypothetical protein